MTDTKKIFERNGQFPENEKVVLPDGLGEVLVKVMTVREETVMDLKVTEKKVDMRTAMIMACAMDEQGSRTFEDEDISKVENTPFYLLEEIFNAALRVNRMTKQDQEELAKNSNGQSDGLLSV